jgi:uncharacterized tellurite resistance protein B-like protein
MGMLDKLSGNKDLKLSPRGALLLSAITMIAVDGDIDDDEIAIIQRLDRKNDGAWEEATKAWKMYEFKDCITKSVDAMNEKQKLSAIANLIDIAMADGVLVGDEKELLEAYIKLFKINESEIEKIVDVMAIKNNDSIFYEP